MSVQLQPETFNHDFDLQRTDSRRRCPNCNGSLGTSYPKFHRLDETYVECVRCGHVFVRALRENVKA